MIEAVKYTRVSTNQQDARGSKDEQDKLIELWASKNNYKIIETFSDTDHGDKENRADFNRLKHFLIFNTHIKHVIVLYSDRFSRDYKQGMRFLFDFDDMGVKVISVNEGELKADGTVESLISSFRFSQNQEEKNKMVKKVTDNMFNYAETNRYLGGSLSPWFTTDKGVVNGIKCKVVIPNNETWDFYRKVFLDMIKYRSIKESCRVNNLKYRTVIDWCLMPELIGYRTYGKKGKVDKNHTKGRRKEYQISSDRVYPAILSDEEYEIIKEIRLKNKLKYMNIEREYLYSTFLECSCNGKFAGEKIKKYNDNVFHYYKCEKCGSRFNADKLENSITEKILSEPKLKMLNDYQFRIADIIDEKILLEKNLDEKLKAEATIASLIVKGFMSEEAAEKELKELNKIKDKIKKDIQQKEILITEEAKKEITEDNIDTLKYLLRNIDFDLIEDLKEILHLIIRKIKIHDIHNIDIIF